MRQKSPQMVRRFDGEEYVAWLVNPSDDRIVAYTQAGVRIRHRGDTLFVHCADEDDAREIDRLSKT